MQIDELHKMSALMGPPTLQTWPEGVHLAAAMGFSFNPQQPIPLHLMVRHRSVSEAPLTPAASLPALRTNVLLRGREEPP